MRRLTPYLLLGVLVLGIGVAMGVGLLTPRTILKPLPSAITRSSESLPKPIYPLPVPGRGQECPNPKNLVPFAPSAEMGAISEASNILNADQDAERRASDRSFWSQLHGSQPGRKLIGFSKFTAQPTTLSSEDAFIIEHSCGATLLSKTLEVMLVPLSANGQAQDCVACIVKLAYVDRIGHPLLYLLW